MKLPSGQNSPPPRALDAKQSPKAANNNGQAAQTLSKLNNTWVTVAKVEPLNPEQSKLAAAQTALNQQATGKSQVTSSEKPQLEQGQTSPPANDAAVKAGLKSAAEVSQLKTQILSLLQNKQSQLNLLTLKHQSGTVRLLSPQNYPVNSQVLIKQDSQGAWALHTASRSFNLSNFAQTHASIMSRPLALLDPNQSQTVQGKQLGTSSLEFPKLSLSSFAAPNAQTVHSAIKSSGQFFEQQLHTAITQTLNSQNATSSKPAPSSQPNQPLNLNLPDSIRSVFKPIANTNQAATHLPVSEKPAPSQGAVGTNTIGQNLNETFKQVEKNINKWVTGLLAQKNSASEQLNTQTLKSTTAVQQAPINNASSQAQIKNQPTSQQPSPLNNQNQQDMKAWLINSQQNLLKQIMSHNQATLQTHAAPEKKENLTQLNSMFTLLLQPKVMQTEKGLTIWPKNLSVQQQLTQLIAQQAPSLTGASKEQDEVTRLLINISQQLNRLQTEQVNNRLQQQQNPESNQLNMSLPYLHEEQVHWCQMEWQGPSQQQQATEQATSWHLVLRFAQHQSSAFAIESQMLQSQLHITLWAEQQSQLKHLHSYMNLLQSKLAKAGFNVANIQSKHGMPAVKNNPISSSLVDVHT